MIGSIRNEKLDVRFSADDELLFSACTWQFDPLRPAVLVVGDNGCGKTTYLNVLSGQLRPHAGTVFMDEVAFSVAVSQSQFGIVRSFQSPLLCDDLRVWENAAIPFFAPWYRPLGSIRDHVNAQLREVGLSQLADSSPLELSFGQRRVLELLRLRLTVTRWRTTLVLLDEPLASLDGDNRRFAVKLVKSIAEQRIPIVIVEHVSAPFAELVCATLHMRRVGNSVQIAHRGEARR